MSRPTGHEWGGCVGWGIRTREIMVDQHRIIEAPSTSGSIGDGPQVEVLVTYDVSTETRAGQRRLRRVANVCLAYGQRVQKSVFECRVSEAQLEELEDKLLRAIDVREDQLRIYRLAGPRERYVKVYGEPPPHDFREPLIV